VGPLRVQEADCFCNGCDATLHGVSFACQDIAVELPEATGPFKRDEAPAPAGLTTPCGIVPT